MKRKIFKFVLLVLLLIYTLPVGGYEVGGDNNDIVFNEPVYDELEYICETDSIKLYFNEANYSIAVENKINGYIWTSFVPEENDIYDDIKSIKAKNSLKALVTLQYSNLTSLATQNCLDNDVEKGWKKINNGIVMDFDFTSAKIKIQMKITIENERMLVKVPMDGIEEYGDYYIVSISPIPIFGNSSNSDEGYIFYPDGSGALYYFEEKENVQKSFYTFNVYCDDDLSIDNIEMINDYNIKNIMLPVYGVKKDDNAFLAYISKGAADANIIFEPSGFKYDLNRIYGQFIYRRSYLEKRFLSEMVLYQKDVLMEDHEICYFFLEGDEADYSGMANRLREYMKDEGTIVKKTQDKGLPLVLDFLMGAKKDNLIFKTYEKFTTLSQSQNMLGYFMDNDIGNIELTLSGYNKKGYGIYPTSMSISSKIGGKGQFNSLTHYADVNNVNLYLEADFINADEGQRGYNIRKDVILDGNQLELTNKEKSKFLLNSLCSLSLYDTFVSRAAKYKVKGICFNGIGNLVPYNNDTRLIQSKENIIGDYMGMLKDASDNFSYISCQGGNMYVLKYADILHDIPCSDSNYLITDESIPFYQMVIHGYVPYTSAYGNLSNNYEETILKWVEYGCIPYYILTYESNYKLTKTNAEDIYSSEFGIWKDIIINDYKRLNESIGYLYDKEIISHDIVSAGIIKVTYKNKDIVYINYNDENFKIGNIIIPAKDFIVFQYSS